MKYAKRKCDDEARASFYASFSFDTDGIMFEFLAEQKKL